MIQKFLTLLSGIIFGLGLSISSMTNPDKVISFLDILGEWDPSLIFVMGGAIVFASPFLYILDKRKNLILVSKIELPDKKNIDLSLIIGSILFGIGWALVGLCPGPAISSIALLNHFSFLFVFSMILGFFICQFIQKK